MQAKGLHSEVLMVGAQEMNLPLPLLNAFRYQKRKHIQVKLFLGILLVKSDEILNLMLICKMINVLAYVAEKSQK